MERHEHRPQENHAEHTLSAIDHALADVSPHDDAMVIAESAWTGLMDSVNNGWMSPEEAERLYYQWFQIKPEDA